MDNDLVYRRQLLNLRIRSVTRRLVDGLQRIRNAFNDDHLETVILVIACNRFEALKEHQESLKKFVVFFRVKKNSLFKEAPETI